MPGKRGLTSTSFKTSSKPEQLVPQRYFVALLPPEAVQSDVTRIKQHFKERYHSRKALNSPPHITLQPPFQQAESEAVRLKSVLQTFAQRHAPLTVQLDGFAAFPPRVIYIHVVRSQSLLQLQQNLMAELEAQLAIVDPISKQRPFHPHLTVAFRDLTPANFKAGWAEFCQQSFQATFTVAALTLLIHLQGRWQIHAQFELTGNEQAAWI